MTEYVWIVGGSVMQEPMLDEVHKRGFNAIVSDGSESAYLFSAKSGDQYKLAGEDYKLVLDTYDADKHVKIACELARTLRIRAVVAPGVDVGPTVSAIAEALGLPAVPYRVALNVRDKAMMRLMLSDEHPAHMLVHSAVKESYYRWSREQTLPCIVKPTDNCATRGMTLVRDEAAFVPAIKAAMLANKKSSGVLIEEMLAGPEFALDFIIKDGEAVWVNGVTRLFRHHIPGTQTPLFGIEGAIVNPFVAPEELRQLASRAARKLEVTEGPFKIDAMFDERYGWCILECATRWSGGFDHMYLAPMVGRDITSVLLDYALGLETTVPPLRMYDDDDKESRWQYAASYVPYYAPMKIQGWRWLYSDEELNASLGLEHVFVRSQKEIKSLENCAERPIFFLASGLTPLDALRSAVISSNYIIPVPA